MTSRPPAGGRRRLTVAALATGIVVGLAVLVPASPASASSAIVACTGTDHVTFSPPVTSTPTSTTLTVLSTYTCTTIGSPTVNSATISITLPFPITLDCDEVLSGLNGSTGPLGVTWDTGSSVATVSAANVNIQGTVQIATNTGTVTSGLFTGGTFQQEATLSNTDISTGCLSEEGLSEIDGTATIAIVKLL